MLEHANIRVPSIQRTQSFLGAAFPDFHVRGSGHGYFGYWLHFGNDNTYVALSQDAKPGEEQAEQIPAYNKQSYRLMHLAYVVDDIEQVMANLKLQGFEPSITEDLNSHPARRRVYYLDGNGMEWEFIQYLSADPAERNDYSDLSA